MIVFLVKKIVQGLVHSKKDEFIKSFLIKRELYIEAYIFLQFLFNHLNDKRETVKSNLILSNMLSTLSQAE